MQGLSDFLLPKAAQMSPAIEPEIAVKRFDQIVRKFGDHFRI